MWSGSHAPSALALSSAETERLYPYPARMIARSFVGFHERGVLNETAQRIGQLRHSSFNCVETFRFTTADRAAEMAELITSKRLDRLSRNSAQGSSREEVAAEWKRIAEERETILEWGRVTGMLREVVALYRFERHMGSWSYHAHVEAAKLIDKAHPPIFDPMNLAGVMIEWSEREHREWFWRCCRDGHCL